MQLYNDHLEESKKLLEEKAKQILLDKEDLTFDKSMLAPVKQKLNNVILSTYLVDFANERLSTFKNLANNETLSVRYKHELLCFLQDLVRRNL
ncbi:MAG: hypothetical protein HY064_14655 [Bacteroidetes bacterium]|nr:hypothetical protein [Bacteroidota bacterium]